MLTEGNIAVRFLPNQEFRSVNSGRTRAPRAAGCRRVGLGQFMQILCGDLLPAGKAEIEDEASGTSTPIEECRLGIVRIEPNTLAEDHEVSFVGYYTTKNVSLGPNFSISVGALIETAKSCINQEFAERLIQ